MYTFNREFKKIIYYIKWRKIFSLLVLTNFQRELIQEYLFSFVISPPFWIQVEILIDSNDGSVTWKVLCNFLWFKKNFKYLIYQL